MRSKLLPRVTPLRFSLIASLVFTAILCAYERNPTGNKLLETLANKSLDLKFVLRGWRWPKSKIVILTGDEAAFQAFGERPWDRGAVFAPAIERLCRLGAKVIAFDLHFTDRERLIAPRVKDGFAALLADKPGALEKTLTENSGDALMRQAIASCKGRVVLGYALRPMSEGPLDQSRAAILTDPRARNVVEATVGPGVRLARSIDDPEATPPFRWHATSALLDLPELTPPEVAQGFVNIGQDSDGLFRHTPLVFRLNDIFLSSFDLRVAQAALDAGDAPPKITLAPDEVKIALPTPAGLSEVPVDRFGQAIINYRGGAQFFPYVSIASLLDDSDQIATDIRVPPFNVNHLVGTKAQFFKDAIVLFNYTAMSAGDVRPRPFAQKAFGVENHANVIDDILAGDFLWRPLAGQRALLLYALCAVAFGLGYGWVIARLNAVWGTVAALVVVGGLFALDQLVLFDKMGAVVFGAVLEAQLFVQYFGIMLIKYSREEGERRRIRAAFDKYVSPAIIDTMLKDPTKLRLGGEKRHLSVLFSDIRGFTTLSEKLDVRTLTQLLNEYLGAMTEILLRNSGTLDKYIGDAVMGFWNAPLETPDHASRAVQTAVEMVAKLGELNPEFERRYGVALEIGIGVNSGEVSVGNFGSERVFEYTVIGDNVNLASRLEGVNKKYGTQIIVSESTFSALPAGSYLGREIDLVKVKGKTNAVKIYEVFPDLPAYASLKAALGAFNDGLVAYYSRQWDLAITCFESVRSARGDDKVSSALIDRCRQFQAVPPPADWDGSHEMDSK